MPYPARPADYLRQFAVIMGAIAGPLGSAIPSLTGTGRTISEQSDAADAWLVPLGLAFSIWGPIFLGLAIYAVLHALPSRRSMAIHRSTGWWAALGMALSGAWAIAASYLPPQTSQWLTPFILTALALSACLAMVRLSRGWKGLDGAERWAAWLPLSLFAGWTSLAMFINWEQAFTGPWDMGTPHIVTSLLLLAAAVGFIAWNLVRCGGNRAYIVPPIWGLALLVIARLQEEPVVLAIAVAAAIGLLLVALADWGARRRAPCR